MVSDSVPGPCPTPHHLLHSKRLGPRPSPSFPSLTVRQAAWSQVLTQIPVTCCTASDSVPGPRPAPRHLLHGKRLGPRPSPSSSSLTARQVTRSQALAQLPVTCCTASDWVPGPRPASRHLLHGKRLGPRPSPSSPSLAARQATRSQALAQLPDACYTASDSVPGPRPAPRHLLHGKRLGPRPSPSSPTLAIQQATQSQTLAHLSDACSMASDRKLDEGLGIRLLTN